jgi:hypothetical protein
VGRGARGIGQWGANQGTGFGTKVSAKASVVGRRGSIHSQPCTYNPCIHRRPKRVGGRGSINPTPVYTDGGTKPRLLLLDASLPACIRPPPLPRRRTQAKADRLAEIKRLNGAAAALRSELGRQEEELGDCRRRAPRPRGGRRPGDAGWGEGSHGRPPRPYHHSTDAHTPHTTHHTPHTTHHARARTHTDTQRRIAQTLHTRALNPPWAGTRSFSTA